MAKQHLIEYFKVNQENVKPIKLTENTKVVQQGGKSFPCRGAYEFPVWRLGEKNLNERVYDVPLAEKLIKEQNVTSGLVNHPADDNNVNPGTTFAVERNPHVREGVMYVDAYLVGEQGQLAHEILEAGGSVGLSSSSYGDVGKDGHVKLEGFEIDRYADWVDNPSYQVFATKDHKIESVESIEEDNTNIIEEKRWNYISNSIIKENKGMAVKDNKVLSIEERNFKQNVKKMFEEANLVEDLQEKIQAYNGIIEFSEDLDVGSESVKRANEEIEKITNVIIELAGKAQVDIPKMEEDSKKVNETLATVKESLNELQEKYDVASDLLDNMKLREDKLKEMHKIALAEKNGMVTAAEYKEALTYAESKDQIIEDLKQEMSILKKKIRTILERNALPEADDKKVDDKEDKGKEKEDDPEYDEAPGDDDEIDEKKKSKKKESVKESAELTALYENAPIEIKSYYEDLVYSNSNVEQIKKEILSAKTLLEAQMKYLNLRDLIGDGVSLSNVKNYRVTEHFGENIEKKKVQEKEAYVPKLPLRNNWV